MCVVLRNKNREEHVCPCRPEEATISPLLLLLVSLLATE